MAYPTYEGVCYLLSFLPQGKYMKKAFTLTELLMVVLVLGILAAVATPKMKQVLETRKTTEAEEMLSAVRTEQEMRCSLGKN